jgi:hypothetical protein
VINNIFGYGTGVENRGIMDKHVLTRPGYSYIIELGNRMKCKPIKRVFRCRFLRLGGIIAGFCTLTSSAALGSADEMIKLPSYTRFQCTICHTVNRPTAGTADLNLFGIDYLGNGKVWNRTLALMNSDGDNCPNGFELADLDGDGVPDEPGGTENSNPGERDCTIALSKQTWGIIKELFSGE